jgi:hypothetical protein
MSARSNLTTLSGAFAAALLLAAGGSAQAQSVSEVDVSGRAPTQIAISLAGKSVESVRAEVRVAARTVCRNAIDNRELEMGDLLWCKQKSAARAFRRYDEIRAGAFQSASLTGAIVLSSR